MPFGSDIRAGKAYVELGMKNNMNGGFLAAKNQLGSFTDQIRAIELKMRNFAVSARNLGLDLIKLGVVMGTPLAFGVKQFADFEQELARISTFLKEPTKLMPQIKTELMRMSNEFGVSADKLANGYAEILSANIPVEQAFNFLGDAVKGSIGNVVDFKDQLSGLITFMLAFEGSGITTARATELLRVAVEEGRIPANDLANSFGAVASSFALAGGSAEELIASYAALSTTGLNVAEQTTMLRGIITAFRGATDEQSKAFEEFTKKVTGIAKPMNIATLETLGFAKVLEILSKGSTQDFGKMFGDVRAITGISVLTHQLGIFNESLDIARKSTNAADNAYKIMMGTLSHIGDKLLVVGKNLGIQFGEVMLETIKNVGNALMDVGNIISAFIKENKDLAITLTKIAAISLLVGGALVSVALVFSVVSTALSGIVAVGSFVIGIFASIAGAIGSLVLFVFSLKGAIAITVVSLIPQILDIGGAWDSVVDSFKSGFNNIKTVFSKFSKTVLEAFGVVKRALATKDYALAVQIMLNQVKIIWFKSIDEIIKQYNYLKGKIIDSFNETKTFIGSWVDGTLNALSELTHLDIFKNVSTLFGDAFADMDGTLEGFALTWTSIWSTMQEVALSVVNVVMNGLNRLNKTHTGMKLFAAESVGATIRFVSGSTSKVDRGIKGNDIIKTLGDNDISKREDILAGTGALEHLGKLRPNASFANSVRSIEKMVEAVEQIESSIDGLAGSDLIKAQDTLSKTLLDIKDAKEKLLSGLSSDMKEKISGDLDIISTARLPGQVRNDRIQEELNKQLDDINAAFADDKKVFFEAVEKIEKIKNDKKEESNNKKLTSLADLDKLYAILSEAAGKTDAKTTPELIAFFRNNPSYKPANLRPKPEKTSLELEQEKAASLDKQLKDTEAYTAFSNYISDIGAGIAATFDELTRTDIKLPKGNADILDGDSTKKNKKITDGIMGAFNINALGDFSKGGVMESVKTLLEEAQKRDTERIAREKEDLRLQQEMSKKTFNFK